MKVPSFSNPNSLAIEEGNPAFDELRMVFNKAIDRKPRCIYVPSSEQEVIDAVIYAKAHNLSISVKAGGHSAFGQSVSDNAVLIDLGGFKKIEIASDLKHVAIGGGVLSGELDRALAKVQLAVPLGDCPDVGVCGLALGGGNGFLSRKYGLTSDHIVELEIITSEEKLIKVNSKNYPELFWAMKGGGQNNFGIVTKLILQLVQPPPKVFVYNNYWPLTATTSVLQKMESLLEEFGDDLSLFPRFNTEYKGLPGLRLYGIYLGNSDAAVQINRALTDEHTPRQHQFDQVTYHEAQQLNVSSIAANLAFHWENAIIPKDLTEDFCKSVKDAFLGCPNLNGRINLDPIGSSSLPEKLTNSAFYHREQGYILSVIGICEGRLLDEETINWAKSSASLLFKYARPYKYQNYAGQTDPLSSYFGSHTKKLQHLKKKYDSTRLFKGLIN